MSVKTYTKTVCDKCHQEPTKDTILLKVEGTLSWVYQELEDTILVKQSKKLFQPYTLYTTNEEVHPTHICTTCLKKIFDNIEEHAKSKRKLLDIITNKHGYEL